MNKIILKGKLTRDPELKYTQSSKAFAKFSLAVQHNFKNEKGEYGVDFINCQVWDKKAETIAEYFKKGSNILLEGRLSVRQYEDEEKQKKTITEVIVESFEFIDSKNKSENKTEEFYNEEVEEANSEFPF